VRVFVAGATGALGRALIRRLVEERHSVRAVAPRPAGACAPPAVDADLCAHDLRELVRGCDAVVDLTTAPDTVTTRRLLDASVACGVRRYVQRSFAMVYRDGGDRWLDEDAPIEHSGGPFRGAAAAEEAAARFGRQGGTAVVLRFAAFYAPDSSHTQAFNRLLRRRINPFAGPPEAYVSSIHAEDAGTAVVSALSAPAGVYNIADDEPLTRRDAGTAAAAALGKRRPFGMPRLMRALAPTSARPLMRSQRISNARFKEATGWAPHHPSIRGSWPATS